MPQRLLLCDDEVHIVRVAQFKLSKAGYEVQGALDGLEAWKLIQAQPPDLVVTDLQMPGLTGFELIDRMRAQPATARTPVILLTAKGYELQHEDIQSKYGDVTVLPKPFSPKALLDLVKEKLQKSQEAQSALAGAAK